MTLEPLRAARVRVPCSTSNLGAGFDCIGLALDRYLDAAFTPGGEALDVVRQGVGAPSCPVEQDLLVRAFRDNLQGFGIEPRGELRILSDIPIARGLGSSAAAAIAGLCLSGLTVGRRWEERTGRRFQPAAVGGKAVVMEGHPDNVGPALLGGLVAASPARPRDPLSFSLTRLPLSTAIGFAFAAPAVEVTTRNARAALPATVPYATATRSVVRVVALLRGLAYGDESGIRVGFDDELHVPYRLPLIPGAESAMEAGCAAGAWAVTISGSGSGLIAACPAGLETQVARAMGEAFTHGATGEVHAFPVRPDEDGTRVLEPAAS